ncbi:MmyB family transcriptional regulator [Streptomyces capillispiralis]|uniref:MmyB family transcriptional regulator n=1 Tax=Streptomyces capillispiralis TaxID=68182 RepID=UPI0035711C33
MWRSGAVGEHRAARKTVDHPRVGAVVLDSDVLGVAGSDLRIMVCTAPPGSADADRPALLDAVGTRSLVG